MNSINLLFSALSGLAFGSFANVYFYRVPKNISLLTPFSFCPHCNHPLRWHDNIPLFSYCLLNGKCRDCQQKISLQYPMIEISCAILFSILSAWFGRYPSVQQAALILFSFILFLAGGIDFVTYFETQKEYGIIPNHLLILLGTFGFLFSFQNPFFNGKFWMGLIGGIGGFALMISVRWLGEKIFKKESLGLGDVKMLSAIGFWIGWQGIIITLIISSLVGIAASFSLIYFKKLNRSSSIPYAPFLSIGALSALFFL